MANSMKRNENLPTEVFYLVGCVLVYRYTKDRNINELRHNSMYGYEKNKNSPLYWYTRTAPIWCYAGGNLIHSSTAMQTLTSKRYKLSYHW